jgi:hypothetical protein
MKIDGRCVCGSSGYKVKQNGGAVKIEKGVIDAKKKNILSVRYKDKDL